MGGVTLTHHLGVKWESVRGWGRSFGVKGDSVGVGIITWGLMGNLRNWGRSPGVKGELNEKITSA